MNAITQAKTEAPTVAHNPAAPSFAPVQRSFPRQLAHIDSHRKRPLACQPPLLQAKLAIGQPDDEYEREADRVAETVMRMPEANARCQPNRTESLQRQATNAATLEQAPSSVYETLRSPGQPLDTETRVFMEPRFGHDFSCVRVHADAKAAESARAVNALAYTVGRNVVFGTGQFAPGTDSGRRLMAHEMAHVVQQSSLSGPPVPRDRDYVSDANQADNIVAPVAPVRAVSRPATPILSREDGSFTSRASNWIFSNMTSGLHGLQRSGVARLRRWAAGYTGTRRTIADGIVTAFNGITEVWIQFWIILVGIVVGLVAGIIQLVIGLFRLVVGLIQGLLLFLYGLIDGGRAFDEWADGVLTTLRNIPAGLSRLFHGWIDEFSRADTERQRWMIAELTGQIEALIASCGLGGAAASRAPQLAVTVGGGERFAVAVAGGGSRVATAPAVVVNVATPVAAGAIATSAAMQMAGSGGGGSSYEEISSGPRSTGEAIDELEETVERGSRSVEPSEARYMAEAGTQIQRSLLLRWARSLGPRWRVLLSRNRWPQWIRRTFPQGGPDAIAINQTERRLIVADAAPSARSMVEVRPGMGRGAPASERTASEAQMVRAGDEGRMLHIEKTIDDANRVAANLPANMRDWSVFAREVYWGAGQWLSRLIRVH